MISFYCRANNREKMSIYLKKTLDWLAVSSRLLSFSGLLTFSFRRKNSRREIHFAAICLGVDVCWLVFSQLWTKDGPGRDGAHLWRFKSGKWRRHRVDSDESSYLTRELLEGLGYGSVKSCTGAPSLWMKKWKEERKEEKSSSASIPPPPNFLLKSISRPQSFTIPNQPKIVHSVVAFPFPLLVYFPKAAQPAKTIDGRVTDIDQHPKDQQQWKPKEIPK